jgi:2-polyprenyl-3-methyl-5-hydroxy-6-metoxy-1,4-benzoquinol methylase
LNTEAMSVDNVVADYGWASGEPPHSCNYIAPAVLRIVRDLRATRVLDLGAGNGSLCGELAHAGHEVVGVEYDAVGVDIASRAFPAIPFHRFSVADDPTLLLRDHVAFDAVVSTEVIEHLYSPHQLVQYAHAVLRPGGHLVITTPYHGYLKNLALALAGHWDRHHTALWHGGHIKFFSRSSLSALLEQNGFDVIGFEGVGRLPWLWKSMLMTARKRD